MSSEKIKIKRVFVRQLSSEIRRTGVGSSKLSTISKAKGRIIESHLIDNIIAGRTKSAEYEDLEHILSIYNSLPNGNIKITKEMKDLIVSKIEEFGRIPTGILANDPSKPETLSAYRIEKFLKQLKGGINQDEWDFLEKRLKEMKAEETKYLSKSDVRKIKELIQKRGLTSIRLKKYIQEKHEKKLKVTFLQDLMDGKVDRIPSKDWEIILLTLEKIPVIKIGDTIGREVVKLSGTIPLTPKMAENINKEIERTQTSHKIIVNAAPKDISLTSNKISRIRRGNLKSVDPLIIEYLTNFLKNKPDARLAVNSRDAPQIPATVSKDYIDLLNFYVNDTDFTPDNFLKYFPNAPKGITANKILEWMKGKICDSDISSFKWVLNKYSDLSDIGIRKPN